MPHRFRQHYTREQARALLPKVRTWLSHLNEQRALVEKLEQRLEHLAQTRQDIGGETVNRYVKSLAAMQEVFREFHRRDLQLKDLRRGLVDFPAFVGGKEVFLCWEQDEDDIEFWHDLEAGYVGRQPL